MYVFMCMSRTYVCMHVCMYVCNVCMYVCNVCLYVCNVAQPSAWPPAHVGPQPGLLPVRSPVLAVGHVRPEQALHEWARWPDSR